VSSPKLCRGCVHLCFYFLLFSVKIMRPTIAIDVNLVQGRFFQIRIALRIRSGADVSVLQFCVYSEFVNSSCYPCFNCWCGLRHGCKGVHLITSIRQPIYGPHPLIGRSSTSSTGFYFSPIRRSPSLPFWMKPEEILFFQYSVGRRMCSSS
jgi:hypothetical protein